VRNDGKVPDFAEIDSRLLSSHGEERLPVTTTDTSKWRAIVAPASLMQPAGQFRRTDNEDFRGKY
jgi:hypothetical protein